jgi:hypothetical protein
MFCLGMFRRCHLALLALAGTGAFLAGCANQAANTPPARIYAVDVTGQAKVCDVPTIDPIAGRTTQAAVKVGNDGGWCGLPVHLSGPAPFKSFLLTARPAHGTVFIHTVGDVTRIDYTPDRGYTGSDSFSVQLIPGDGIVHENVTIVAP